MKLISMGFRRSKPRSSASESERQRDRLLQVSLSEMWSDPGTGFEANVFSPMGTAEREVRLVQGLRSVGHNKPALVMLAAIAGGFLLVIGLAAGLSSG